MERTIASHDSLLGGLAGLDLWLSKMGVPARSSDRIHQLIRLLQELKPPGFGSAMRITREQQRQYMYALAELVEFDQIFLAFKDEDPKILGPKLVHCLRNCRITSSSSAIRTCAILGCSSIGFNVCFSYVLDSRLNLAVIRHNSIRAHCTR
jgi:hypothetical protein